MSANGIDDWVKANKAAIIEAVHKNMLPVPAHEGYWIGGTDPNTYNYKTDTNSWSSPPTKSSTWGRITADNAVDRIHDVMAENADLRARVAELELEIELLLGVAEADE